MTAIIAVHAVLAALAVAVATPIALYARTHQDKGVYGTTAQDDRLTDHPR